MQGTESASRLIPQLLSEACENAGVALVLRIQRGYDYSYAYMATKTTSAGARSGWPDLRALPPAASRAR